jgi:hypothetical protein
MEMIMKAVEYTIVKTQILPRMVRCLETTTQPPIRIKILETFLNIIDTIDKVSMQEVLVKSFEKVRQLDSSPEVCMLLLRLYKRMADTLGTEMIGVVVLPAILPMLVKG